MVKIIISIWNKPSTCTLLISRREYYLGKLKFNFITFSVSKNLFSKMKEMQFLTTSSLCALLKTVLPFSIMETNKEKEEYTSVKCLLQEPQRISESSLKKDEKFNVPSILFC